MNMRGAIIAGIVSVPIVLLLAFGMTKDPRDIPSPLPGRAAPAFTMQALEPGPMGTAADRDTVRLADLRGDVVVLNFYASWCLACRDEHAVLSMMASSYRDAPVRFYSVLYDDKPENIKRWIQEMGGQAYPTLLDPGSRTAINYGLYGVPETFFISPDGTVAYKNVGPVTPDVVRQKVDSLLAVAGGGAAPAAPVAPAPGEPLPGTTGAGR